MLREILQLASAEIVKEYDLLAEMDAWKIGYKQGVDGKLRNEGCEEIVRMSHHNPEDLKECYLQGFQDAQQGESMLIAMFRYFSERHA